MVRKPIHADAGATKGAEANKERKGLWSPEEDERLFNQITYHGVSTWSSVAQLAGKNQYLQTERSGDQI
jgi:myb proto-oncogene protein